MDDLAFRAMHALFVLVVVYAGVCKTEQSTLSFSMIESLHGVTVNVFTSRREMLEDKPQSAEPSLGSHLAVIRLKHWWQEKCISPIGASLGELRGGEGPPAAEAKVEGATEWNRRDEGRKLLGDLPALGKMMVGMMY